MDSIAMQPIVSLAAPPRRRYLLASDFDKTLSLNDDSGAILSEMIGIAGFDAKVERLATSHLIQQGGELAYLLVHDPDYRSVRRHHLQEVGRRIRLKRNLALLRPLLSAAEGHEIDFHVISAAPEELICAALAGIVDPSHIHGTRFVYTPDGAIDSVVHVTAGYGKVAALDEVQAQLGIGDDRIIYVGDGCSDVHVMLHVSRRDGYTIAVSETRPVAQIARRTVLGDDALGIVVPILEDLFGWDAGRIRGLFESQQLAIREWSKARTDWITITGDLTANVSTGREGTS
jgi:HAD superfamily phosphoserine phosphatase-like hydrolase